MTLEDLGYNKELRTYRKEHDLESLGIGRVTLQHKDRYSVRTEADEFDAEVIGNLRFTAANKNDLPVVGDWVSISIYDDSKALIHTVFPRKSIVERKAVGKLGQTQIIAANIDFGLIVQSVNRDFNINRLERYLTICNASRIKPLIVLSKVDLIEKPQLEALILQVTARIRNVPLIAISHQSQLGIEKLKSELVKGCTYCLLGSSGVGKSTLINVLTGINLMDTGEISESIDRGRHVTSHRELVVLDQGILIDNPGMREVGITHVSEGLEATFDEISSLANDCKYNDCTHTNETGCAVLQAIENKELDPDAYANFMKMQKEKMHFESNARERKKKDKELGKMIKTVQKQKRNNRY